MAEVDLLKHAEFHIDLANLRFSNAIISAWVSGLCDGFTLH